MVATDFSEVMAQQAKANTVNCENVCVVTCDCRAIPFTDGIFSKVLIYGVVQYLSQAQVVQMLGEAQRVVWPGGRIMLGEIARARDVHLLSRIRDVWTHQGLWGVLCKMLDNLFERWLRVMGRWTHRFVRPKGPPITLHSEEVLLELVHQCGMCGWVWPQSDKLPWFHQTFDLLIENTPATEVKETLPC
jgi:ubiquinone/menaquinone biosynthesis C-methylase UbiE